MPLDQRAVESVTFDSFTTIVDVHGSTRRALSRYIDDPDAIATLWRQRAVEYRMLVNFCGDYGTYLETTRDALEYALEFHDIQLSSGEIDDIMAAFYELDVFDDVRPGMETIATGGYNLYIASNGNEDLLESMIQRAGIGNLVDTVVSANEIEIYKPDVRFYRHVAERVSNAPTAIAHVATPWYDVYGAMHAGMQGVWVNRQDRPWDKYDGTPDRIVEGFEELATELTAG